MKQVISLFILILLFFSVSLAAYERRELKTLQAASDQVTETAKAKDDKPEVEVNNGLQSFAGLVKRLKPAVVNISTTSVVSNTSGQGFVFESPFGENDPLGEFFNKFFQQFPNQPFTQRGLGSGLIVSEDGYVVTNNHVVDRARDIEVVLEGGEKYKAEVVGKDPKTDIAVLKINPKRRLQAVSFGDSDKLEIGDWVIAIGNPFGLGHTVTAGIVSAKGRSLGMGSYDDFIQTDAPINPGNSGGPLFNLNGEVVGVDTAIVAGGQGIGFAIPANLVSHVVDQIKTNGKAIHGWLGVMVQPITPEIAEGMKLSELKGALVADVSPGGPADKAGIKRGDVIVALNGKKVDTVSELTNSVGVVQPGTKEDLKLVRDGVEREVSVKIGELPENLAVGEDKSQEVSEEKLGLVVQGITPQIADRLNLDESMGVIVTNVSPGSVAQETGFRPGDVIVEINNKSIKNMKDYDKATAKLEKGESTLFLVKRGENTIYLAVKIEK
ncbi:MAG: DegQ family serine endoprotease [Thermodesulfobacteriota bacterium]